MKVADINKILHAIHEASDFIANNTDADETGIGQEMLENLHYSEEVLRKEQFRIMLNSAKSKIIRNRQKGE